MTGPDLPRPGHRVMHRLSGRVGKVKMLENRRGIPGARVQFDGSTNAPWIPLTVVVPVPKKDDRPVADPDQQALFGDLDERSA